jgi:hypothetical protein
MSKSDRFEYNTLRLTFNGVGITNIATSAGTTALWLALASADPGDPGSTAAEGGYAAYARVLTQRSTAGWAVTSGAATAVASASPVANIDFAAVATTSTGTFTHAIIYPASNSTAEDALYIGTISPVTNFSQGVTPRITTASSITED